MNIFKVILKDEIQNFIIENTSNPISNLALKKNPFVDVDYKLILNQIESRNKSKNKLPTWFNSKKIVFPNKISVEQTSSEITANYKSQLIFGENIIDLSGGFGVDDYYFSKKVNQVIHCEINEELSEIVQHNFNQLNVTNILCIKGDSSKILSNINQKFCWIYIDPSRRDESKGKVFLLKDCLPNVTILQDYYFKFSDNILIKTSPILDITAGLSELKNVKTLHIIAVDNEVKELLWVIEKNYSNSIEIKTINIEKNSPINFNYNLSSESKISYSLPKKYIYEPNAAIMKSGGFNEVASQFKLKKLHLHSHLYTSNERIRFPGRVFEIQKIVPYTKNEMKVNFLNSKSNVAIRNFPEKVENLRKKWKINEGGNTYSFFTTDCNNNKIALICIKT